MTNEEDVLVMYFVVKKSLNMSILKTAAQVAHAMQYILDDYHLHKINGNDKMYKWLTEENVDGKHRKVVLYADDKEWEKLKQLEPKPFIVIDAGLTEIPEHSETTMVFWPMFKSERPKIIKRLRCS